GHVVECAALSAVSPSLATARSAEDSRHYKPQLIQSHQKRRSMLSSSRSQKNKSNEKPYRAGQSLAGPPRRAAQLFSSFLKNRARCDRTFSVSKSFSILAQLLWSGVALLPDLSGSAPRKSRTERRSSVGFLCRSSKK